MADHVILAEAIGTFREQSAIDLRSDPVASDETHAAILTDFEIKSLMRRSL